MNEQILELQIKKAFLKNQEYLRFKQLDSPRKYIAKTPTPSSGNLKCKEILLNDVREKSMEINHHYSLSQQIQIGGNLDEQQNSVSFNLSQFDEHQKNIIIDHNRMLSSKLMSNKLKNSSKQLVLLNPPAPQENQKEEPKQLPNDKILASEVLDSDANDSWSEMGDESRFEE